MVCISLRHFWQSLLWDKSKECVKHPVWRANEHIRRLCFFSRFCCLHSCSRTTLCSHICSQTSSVFAAGPKVASIIQFFIYWWFCLAAPWGVAPADKRNCHNVEGINPSAPFWHTDRVMTSCWRIICFSCKSYWSVVWNLPLKLFWMINDLKWLQDPILFWLQLI